MGVVLTLLLNGVVGLSAYGLARDAFRMPRGLPRALAAAVLAWTWVTLGMQLLGPVGFYQVGSLMAWAGFALVIASAVHVVRPAPRDVVVSKPEAGWGISAVLAVGLTLWSGIGIFTNSLLMPVKVVSDGPIYHLYFAARWWKEGRLFLIASPFGENAATYFPAGGDLWFTWLMIPWGGDRLARVGQVPFMIWALSAAYALARRVGVAPASAVVATCWLATVMPFLLFSFEANVDTIFIAGYLTAVYFFFRDALGDDKGRSLALGALAAGGAWGTKPTAMVFVPVILGLAGLHVLLRKTSSRTKLLHLSLLLILPMVMAGFWFVRNAVLSGGNPLYPLHARVFGKVLLRGWYEAAAMKHSQFYLEREDWRAFVDILNGVLDPRLSLVWLAALLGAWSIGWRRPYAGWIWGFSGLAALNVACYWLVIPYRTQQRFMLQGVGLWVVPLACLFDRSRLIRALAVGLLAIHVFTPPAWPLERPGGGTYWDLSRKIPSAQKATVPLPRSWAHYRALAADPAAALGFAVMIGTGLAAFAVAWSWAHRARRPNLKNGCVALGLTLCFVTGSAYLTRADEEWKLPFPPFLDYLAGWIQLESRSGREGSRIAYAGTNLPYYLMCRGLRNDVRYVNINRHATWLLHDYHRAALARGVPTWDDPRPLWDRLEQDYDAWLENLRGERIQILVVARAKPEDGPGNIADSQRFTIERQWAENHPESFTPLYGVRERDPEFRFFRVHPVPKKSVPSSTDLHGGAH